VRDRRLPGLDFAGLGYTAEAIGQKGPNGVARSSPRALRGNPPDPPGTCPIRRRAGPLFEIEAEGVTVIGI